MAVENVTSCINITFHSVPLLPLFRLLKRRASMMDTAKMYFHGGSARPIGAGANTRKTQMKDSLEIRRSLPASL